MTALRLVNAGDRPTEAASSDELLADVLVALRRAVGGAEIPDYVRRALAATESALELHCRRRRGS